MLQDLRYAVRMMALRPLVTALTIALLTIGIAASVVTFCLADAIVWNPMPFRDPERLVHVRSWSPAQGTQNFLQSAAFEAWGARSEILSATYTWSLQPAVIGPADRTESVTLGRLSPGLFSELGVTLHGRDFLPSDIGRDVLILSDETWRTQFDLAPDAIGRTLLVEGRPYAVIGIAPRGFHFPYSPVRGWVPQSTEVLPPTTRVIGRLRPGVTLAQAAQFAATTTKGFSAQRRLYEIRVVPFAEVLPQTAHAVTIVLAAGLCLLFIAVANAGNLLLAEAVRRGGELAVRRTLGASGFALARQAIVEGALRCAIAVGGALAVVRWSLQALTVSMPRIMTFQALRPFELDGRAVAFSVGVSTLAALGVALAPCAFIGRANLHPVVQLHATTATTNRSRLRDALTVGQLVATLVLLASAALLVNGFVRLIRVQPGYAADGLSIASIVLTERQVADHAATEAQVAALKAEALGIPSVVAATIADGMPVGTLMSAGAIEAAGGASIAESAASVSVATVEPDFFSTIGLRIVSGGAIRPGGAELQAVITRSLADRLWPDRDPIGERLRLDVDAPWLTVTGVATDIRIGGLDQPLGTYAVFTNRFVGPPRFARVLLLIVRSTLSSAALSEPLRAAVRRALPGAAVRTIASAADSIAADSMRARFATRLMAGLAVIALALAMLGVYGAFWCAVRQRQRELGVRLAIGAAPRDVVSMVLGDGMRLLVVAFGIGLPLTIASTMALRPLLFEVSPVDPLTLLFVGAVMTAAALAAAYGPARHASRIDPVETLRAE